MSYTPSNRPHSLLNDILVLVIIIVAFGGLILWANSTGGYGSTEDPVPVTTTTTLPEELSPDEIPGTDLLETTCHLGNRLYYTLEHGDANHVAVSPQDPSCDLKEQ